VVICGLRRDHEPIGDLPGGEAEGEQPEHFGLASKDRPDVRDGVRGRGALRS
jgi:hypothetical protein